MAQEIERKFLVRNDLWRQNAAGVLVRQGFLFASPQRAIRVRVAGDKGYLTIKGPTTGISRREFEYGIPADEANEMLNTLADGRVIEKRRYEVPFSGKVWEVDEFLGDNAGLVVAEVELASEREEVPLPPWVGEDVSDRPQYLNVNLAKHPFCKWPGGAGQGI